MADAPVQPEAEQGVQKTRHPRQVFQRTGRIHDILRLEVESRGHGNTHAPRDLVRAPPELERQIQMHDIRSGERRAEQRIAWLGELHLLFGGHPGDQRHLVDPCRIFGGADADESDMVTLPLQFVRILQCGVRRAVALVADGVHDQHDGHGAIQDRPVLGARFFVLVVSHCFILSRSLANHDRDAHGGRPHAFAACLHGRVLVDAMYSASPPLNVGPARVNRPVRTIVTRADCRRKRPVIREIHDRLS